MKKLSNIGATLGSIPSPSFLKDLKVIFRNTFLKVISRNTFLKDLKVISDLPIKLTLTILVVVSFLMLPKVGYLPLGHGGFDITHNILFPLSHANVFHLICNILCLWQIRSVSRWVTPAVIISFLASFLPVLTLSFATDLISICSGAVLSEPTIVQPTMGFSGILFAILGLQYGFYDKGRQMLRNTWFFFLITAFIPNIAVLFHIYCIAMAFVAGWVYGSYCLWKKISCI